VKKKRTATRFGGDLSEPELALGHFFLEIDAIAQAIGYRGPTNDEWYSDDDAFRFLSPHQPEPVKQMITETFAKHFSQFFKAKFNEDYETTYYETLLHSPEKRRAFDFVRLWYQCAALMRKDGNLMTGDGFLAVLAPLFDAFEKRDTEFFKGLAEAVGIIEQREKSNKIKYQGSLNKWLLECARA
jgi:hypothetical protein